MRLIALLTALVLSLSVAVATASAATQYEGTVTSINKAKRTFRLNDSERGTIRIKVTRNTVFQRINGFNALTVGMKRVEATVKRSNGRWVATHVERSGGGGRHGGDDDEVAPGMTSVGAQVPQRSDIRNVAIIAHVDHGKTTLVDAMLRQSGVFSAHEQEALTDRVMDSMDQERERGITILAKNAAVRYGDVKLNLVDTPGHADFGGEVERGLTMVDGVMLLVDASEGPLPQTRFVLRKALEARLPVVLVVNKVDRPDARIGEVVDEVYELFLDLDADEEQIEFPIVYTNAKAGWASTEEGVEGTDLRPLFDLLVERIPAPTYDESHPLQARVTNLDADPLRRPARALPRAPRRRSRGASRSPGAGATATVENVRVAELYVNEGLERVDADEAGPGEIIALAGIPEITIGETIADPDDPRPLPLIAIDEPALGDDDRRSTPRRSPGSRATRLTARHGAGPARARAGRQRRDPRAGDRPPDTWEVQGRGELQLAVLVETMRREGFELTVGKPQVVTREVDGKVHEPIERLAIDVPEDFLGVVTQMLALRKGRMENMVNHGTGWVRLEFLVPDPRADRLPHRVPHRDARLGDPPLGLRGLRALAGRDPHAPDRARSWPTAAGRPPRSRC